MSDTMQRSWLVQRLNKPRTGGILGADNPFSFGGGLRNGGLSDYAMSLLRPIFSFDYMGAAEFEFGAVPEALNRIAKQAGNLSAWSFTIDQDDICKPMRWRGEAIKPMAGERRVYVLAPSAMADEAESRIRVWAKEPYQHTKESVGIDRALWPQTEWDDDHIGWLELNNGFLFFTDRDAWAATASLFGVEVTA